MTPAKASAHIYGWRWHVDDAPHEALLWASRLRFASPVVPLMLWFPTRNMHFKCGADSVHGWCFQTASGPIFLVPRKKDWFIAFGTSERPTRTMIVSALNAIGFVLGEDLGVGIFHSVRADSTRDAGFSPWIFAFPVRRTSRVAPALPLTDDAKRDLSGDVADLIEKLIAYQAANPAAPISVAIHHYFESLDGLVEKQFLPRMDRGGSYRQLGDRARCFQGDVKGANRGPPKWTAWVRSQRSDDRGVRESGDGGPVVRARHGIGRRTRERRATRLQGRRDRLDD